MYFFHETVFARADMIHHNLTFYLKATCVTRETSKTDCTVKYLCNSKYVERCFIWDININISQLEK